MTAFTFRARLARAGDFLRDHQLAIQRMQWAIVIVYVALLVLPALLPLPDRTASVFNNLSIVAQFAFWGIWWPFVLLSMPLFGRAWCGFLGCTAALPEPDGGDGGHDDHDDHDCYHPAGFITAFHCYEFLILKRFAE